MLHVLAIITAKPGRRAQVLAELNAVIDAIRAEPGCIEYQPTVDAPGGGPNRAALGPDGFVVIEKWASPAALAAHAVSPAMATYIGRAAEFIAERSVHVLTADVTPPS